MNVRKGARLGRCCRGEGVSVLLIAPRD
jgi:hypothetical protein